MFRRYLACAVVSLFVLDSLGAVEVLAQNTTPLVMSIEQKVTDNEKIVNQI